MKKKLSISFVLIAVIMFIMIVCYSYVIKEVAEKKYIMKNDTQIYHYRELATSSEYFSIDPKEVVGAYVWGGISKFSTDGKTLSAEGFADGAWNSSDKAKNVLCLEWENSKSSLWFQERYIIDIGINTDNPFEGICYNSTDTKSFLTETNAYLACMSNYSDDGYYQAKYIAETLRSRYLISDYGVGTDMSFSGIGATVEGIDSSNDLGGENLAKEVEAYKMFYNNVQSSGANITTTTPKVDYKENKIGPIKLTYPNAVSSTESNNEWKSNLEISGLDSITYTLEDSSGKGYSSISDIPSGTEFYICTTATDLPEEIKITNSYKYYKARFMIGYGGFSQSRTLYKGTFDTHKSFVTIEINSKSDIEVKNSIWWVDSPKETLKKYQDTNEEYNRKNYSDEQKKSTKVYVEEGDIVKHQIYIQNNKSTAKIKQIEISYMDTGLELAWEDEIGVIQPSHRNINSVWDRATLTAKKRIHLEKGEDYSGAVTTKELQNINLGNTTNYFVNKVTAKQTTSVSSTPLKTTVTVPTDNGNITPEDGDTSNNSSNEYVYLKSIDASIKKEVSSINGETPKSKNGKISVEYGDTITYKITVKNEGTSSVTSSNIYNPVIQEEIPESMKFISLTDGSNVYGSSDLSYSITKDGIFADYTINTSLSPKSTKSIYFTYKVISYGQQTGDLTISNTAKLVSIQNRNECKYTINDSSTANVYVKSYKLNVNKYLYKAAPKDGNIDTENIVSNNRSNFTEWKKKTNPVYVEYGDKLLYLIDIKNTGETTLYNIKIQDYFKSGDFEIDSSENLTPYTSDGKTYLDFTIDELAPNETFTISLLLNANKVLQEGKTDTLMLNTAKVIYAENKNDLELISNSNSKIYGTIESTEYCQEKLYQLRTSKYISSYNGIMMEQNIQNGLITRPDEVEDYYEGSITKFIEKRKYLSEEDKKAKPFAVEKTETIKYTIRVDNQISEDMNNNASVYIVTISDYLDNGLTLLEDSIVAKKYKSSKSNYEQFTDFSIEQIEQNTDTFLITFSEPVELLAGEHILFEYAVKITESNMSLDLLKNEAIISKLTNRNDKTLIEQLKPGTTSVDTNLNIEQNSSSDYVKLKETVISGHVWNDTNENGLKDSAEVGIEGVKVELNGLTENSKQIINEKLTEVYTDSNGLYTFGRVFRTKSNNNYENALYISYQYDGVKYQSTIYSGKDNLNNENNSYYLKPDYKIDSNARELNNTQGEDIGRIEFNDSLKTIYYDNSSKDFEITDSDKELSYIKTSNDEESTSKRIQNYTESNTNQIKSYSFLRYDNQEEVIDGLWFENVTDAQYDTEYLKYINLGLTSRVELDLSITEKLDNVTNTVFGDSIGYNYSDDETKFEYYPEDYYYKYTDYKNTNIQNYLTQDSELTTEVTYKATLQNGTADSYINDDNVIVAVNELAIYLDNKFVTIDENGLIQIAMKKSNTDEIFYNDTIASVKAYYINEFGEEVELVVSTQSNYQPLESQLSIEEKAYVPLYVRTADNSKGIIIPNSLTTEEGNKIPGFVDIYLKFVDYNRSDISELITIGEKYNHTLEITSYSSYYENDSNYYKDNSKYEDTLEKAGKGAGYIDIDSNPGNVSLGDTVIIKDRNTSEISYEDSYIIDFFNPENSKYDEDDTCRGEIELLVETIPDGDPETGTGTGTGGGGTGTGTGTGNGTPNLNRKITGIVFEDARSEEVSEQDENGNANNIQYIGDGLYNEVISTTPAKTNSLKDTESKDSLVQGVTVKLYKIIKVSDNCYYEIDLSDENEYIKPQEIVSITKDITDEEGSYELNGFSPGTYFTRFEYGNTLDDQMLIYNGQDYKSTTLADESKYSDLIKMLEENSDVTNLSEQEKIKSYRNLILKYIEDTEGSNAIDDPLKRLETMKYTTEINNLKGEILSAPYKVYKIRNELDLENGINSANLEMYKTLSSLMINNTNMYADSIEFYVRSEKIEYGAENLEEVQNVDYKSRPPSYKLENLSFGLQYRPENELTLREYIKEIRLESSAGDKTIIQISYDEDKNIIDSKGLEHVQALDTDYNNPENGDYTAKKGFKFINLDEQFLQGAMLYVTYGIYVDNTGEIDRIGNELYESGISKTEYIKNLEQAIEYYNDEYYTSDTYNQLKNNFVYETLKSFVENDFKYESIDVWYNELLEIYNDFYLANSNGNYGYYSKQFLDISYYIEDESNIIRRFIEQAQKDSTGYNSNYIENNPKIDENLFDKNTLISDLSNAINELEWNTGKQIRRKTKDYNDYYTKYLGTTYYSGKINDDVIVETKINQIVNDIDGEMLFDSPTYNQDWTAIDDIQTLVNSGTYLFINDYNMNNNFITKEQSGFANSFVSSTINKYILVYDEFVDLYGEEEAFEKWYKSMIDEFRIYDILGQGITNTFGSGLVNYCIEKYKGKYENEFLYLFINQIGNDAFNYLDGSETKKEFENKDDYNDVLKILYNSEFRIVENALNYIYNEINDKPLILAKEDGTPGGKLFDMNKVVSVEYDEVSSNNEYNTTNKFITPIENDNISEKNRATIDVVTQRGVSSDILNHIELSFENASEIINYTSVNGRRTAYATTVGNGIKGEVDSDDNVETVTFSKPTGLSQAEQKLHTVRTGIIWTVILGIAILSISSIIYILKRRNKKHFIK